MTYSDKIYKELYGKGEFADQIAYGIFAAHEAMYIKKHTKKDSKVSDEDMKAFYDTEEAQIDVYKAKAANEIQALSDEITKANTNKLLEQIAEKINGKHPIWKSIGLNLLASLIWNVVFIGLGILAYFKFDWISNLFNK